MQWSQLKHRIEAGFADSARGRVEVWNTRYRRSHDHEGEGWMTIDKERVASFGSVTFMTAEFSAVTRLRQAGSSVHEAYEITQDRQRAQGLMPLWGFNAVLFDDLNMPIDAILASDIVVVRALGMFDRRCGKARLRTMVPAPGHPLVQLCHRKRCEFEGIAPKGPAGPPVQG